MKLVKCNSQHFYDGDRFSVCPHCNKESAIVEEDSLKTMPLDVTAEFEETVLMGDVEKEMEGKKSSVISGTSKDIVSEDDAFSPVTGWLVCTEGGDRGRSYELKPGKNSVGRTMSNDVIIRGDKSISREQHCVIIYEDRMKTFFVQPGAVNELFYVNGNAVYQPTAISDRDSITVGNTKLLLVTLVGNEFEWNL